MKGTGIAVWASAAKSHTKQIVGAILSEPGSRRADRGEYRRSYN